MATVSQAQLDEIKARIDLGELVESYGYRVRRVGSRLVCCCPFHNEKTPSFSIDPARGFYHCFGCGESGTAITFVCRQEGLGFLDAVRKLAQRAGIKLEEKEDPQAGVRNRLFAAMNELAQFYHRCLDIREAALAREYLEKRDLGPDVRKNYVLGYAPKGIETISKWAAKYGFTLEELDKAGVIKMPERPGDRGYHRFGGRLMFPIADRNGRIVAFSGRQLVEDKHSGKYVNSPETLIFSKSAVLFGFDKAARHIARAENREVIICEGQIDCIRLHICGFPNSVASQGTAFTSTHAQMLRRVADSALLCYDDDAAGHKATVRAAGILMAAGLSVRVASLPDGDDPDSFLRTKGAGKFREMVAKRTESIVAFQVRSERAKERNPDSADAIGRISGAVLATIAQCANAVVKSVLLEEAAKLLKVPVFALAEEMSKLAKRMPPAAKSEEVVAEAPVREVEDGNPPSPNPGRDAAAILPPTRRERAMIGIMMANPGDRAIESILRELFRPEVYGSEFARDFADAYLKGETASFGGKLGDLERKWLTEIELESSLGEASDESPGKQMQELARGMWEDYLARLRFNEDDPMRQLEYQMEAKRLRRMRWPDFKQFTTEFREKTK